MYGDGMPMADTVLDVLGEPARRRLVAVLAEFGECTVTELVDVTGFRQPQVSKHLKTLAEASLVAVRPDGRFRRYRLAGEGLKAGHDWFGQFEDVWQDRFDALDALVSSDAASRTPSPTKEHP